MPHAPLRQPPAILPARVRVYRNLTRQCLSLQAGGRVIGHAYAVLIGSARPVISEAGRQRVIETGHKNVHAYVEGAARVLPAHKAMDLRLKAQAAGKAERIRYEPTQAAMFAYVDRPGVYWNGGGAVLLACLPGMYGAWLIDPEYLIALGAN